MGFPARSLLTYTSRSPILVATDRQSLAELLKHNLINLHPPRKAHRTTQVFESFFDPGPKESYA